ncbi:hypothetical protein LX36DRAFT_120296 [Colletotrichum falcatum]|nr:hypothetical protein LX36DRAFT_120296 [Colletotrichum falcatum]
MRIDHPFFFFCPCLLDTLWQREIPGPPRAQAYLPGLPRKRAFQVLGFRLPPPLPFPSLPLAIPGLPAKKRPDCFRARLPPPPPFGCRLIVGNATHAHRGRRLNLLEGQMNVRAGESARWPPPGSPSLSRMDRRLPSQRPFFKVQQVPGSAPLLHVSSSLPPPPPPPVHSILTKLPGLICMLLPVV